MNRNLLGVAIHNWNLTTRAAIRRAAEWGLRCVELSAVTGETTPANLSQSGRRELSMLVRNAGMTIAAIDAAAKGQRSSDPRCVDELVSVVRGAIEMARDLAVRLVTISEGITVVADSGDDSTRQALTAIGQHADRVGVVLAIPLAGSQPEVLLELLARDINCPALRFCADPADAMLAERDPAQIAALFAEWIAYSHLRDAIAGPPGRAGHETPIGDGHVDFPAYCAAIAATGYPGPHVLKRAGGVTRADIDAVTRLFQTIIPPSW